MYHNELFGLRLRKLRNRDKETQKDLAEFLGVKPNQIGEMENGRGATTLPNWPYCANITIYPPTICWA